MHDLFATVGAAGIFSGLLAMLLAWKCTELFKAGVVSMFTGLLLLHLQTGYMWFGWLTVARWSAAVEAVLMFILAILVVYSAGSISLKTRPAKGITHLIVAAECLIMFGLDLGKILA